MADAASHWTAWAEKEAEAAPPLPSGALSALGPVRKAVADHLAAKDKR